MNQPLPFDHLPSGPEFRKRRNTVSRHHAVKACDIGPKSVTVTMDWADWLEMTLAFAAKGVVSGDSQVVLSFRDAPNAPERFVMQTAP